MPPDLLPTTGWAILGASADNLLRDPNSCASWFYSGWWFGTFYIFPYIVNLIIPIDELIFFRGVIITHQPVLDSCSFDVDPLILDETLILVSPRLSGWSYLQVTIFSAYLPPKTQNILRTKPNNEPIFWVVNSWGLVVEYVYHGISGLRGLNGL